MDQTLSVLSSHKATAFWVVLIVPIHKRMARLIGPAVLRSPEVDRNGQKWTGLVLRKPIYRLTSYRFNKYKIIWCLSETFKIIKPQKLRDDTIFPKQTMSSVATLAASMSLWRVAARMRSSPVLCLRGLPASLTIARPITWTNIYRMPQICFRQDYHVLTNCNYSLLSESLHICAQRWACTLDCTNLHVPACNMVFGGKTANWAGYDYG